MRTDAQHLRQQREDRGTEQRADDGLGTAQQHVEHDGDAERDIEILSLDEAEMMSVEAAADAGDGRAEREGGDLEPAHVDAHEIGHPLIIVQRGHRDAEAGGEQQPYQHDDDRGRADDLRQPDEGSHRIAGGAADNLQIENDRLHDLPERKGGEREIDAAGAQHRHRDRERDQAGHQSGRWNGDQGRQLEHVAQIGRGVGANGREASQAEIELARRERQKAAIGEHDIHRQQDQHAFQIAAHTRACPVSEPANKPVGRMNRIRSNKP